MAKTMVCCDAGERPPPISEEVSINSRRKKEIEGDADASRSVSAKVNLASKLNELFDERGLSQSAAAELLGMPQPKVSAIRNYKLRGISLERLMQALLAMNQQVEIVVKPGRKAGVSSIRVAV